MIGDSVLKFTTKDGALLFSIPLSGVTEVANQTDIRDASLGKKILFGFLAGSREQEFVQLTYETEEVAEGIVFKVKQGISPGLVAKLKFAIKKIQGKAPSVRQLAREAQCRSRISDTEGFVTARARISRSELFFGGPSVAASH